MTMLLASVRLELTTLAFLAAPSDQLTYRTLFEEDAKIFQLRGWKRREIKDYILHGEPSGKYLISSENWFDRHKGQIKN